MGKQLLLEIRDRLLASQGSRPPMPGLPFDFLPNPRLREILAQLSSTSSAIFSFANGLWADRYEGSLPAHKAHCAQASTPYVDVSATGCSDGRNQAILFRNRLYICGIRSDGRKVLYSDDGIIWTALSNALPVSSATSSSIVFNNQIWTFQNDGTIAVSNNGLTWATTYTGPSGSGWTNYQVNAVVHNNAVYVIGGQLNSSSTQAVFRTTNGVDWTNLGNLGVNLYGGCGVISFGGYIIVAGTSQFRISTDGITWTNKGASPYDCEYTGQRFARLGRQLYVTGASVNGTQKIWKLAGDVAGWSWSELGTNAAPYNGHAGGFVGYRGRLVRVAGLIMPGSVNSDKVYRYNPLLSALDVTTDLSATGGYRKTIDGWYQDNAAASQTDVQLTRLSGTAADSFLVLRAGSLTGLLVVSNEARSAGTLTATVFVNGVASSLTAVLDGTNTTQKITTSAKDSIALAAGDLVDVRVTTSADWAPTTADIRACVEIEN